MSDTSTLSDIFQPRSVAVVGASERAEKYGGRVLRALVEHGYPGRIVPVNPSHQELLGLDCFPSLRDVPGPPPDVAVLAVPLDALEVAVRDCAEAGVKGCVVLTIGFAEVGPEGVAAQDRLVNLAAAGGMRLIGPNCLGYMNPYLDLVVSSSVTVSPPLLRGGVGLISQSGALMVSIYHRARDAGIGFSMCVSLGNQADLEIAEVLEHLAHDEHTRAVCIYVEEFKDPGRMRRAVRACRRAGKPVVVVKAGRTALGAGVARSHTASLAGSYRVTRALLGDDGALFTDDPDGMVLAADALSRWPLLSSDGIGLLCPSGGGLAIAADRVAEAGWRLAALGPATQSRLQQLLVPGHADNPIDLGSRVAGDPAKLAAATTAALAGDPDVGVLLVCLTTMPSFVEVSSAIARAAVESGKPTLVVVMPGTAGDSVRSSLSELGCRTYDRLDDGLRVLQVLLQSHGLTRPQPSVPERLPGLPAPDGHLDAAPGAMLNEVEAKALLARYGIPVNRGEFAVNLGQAQDAAAAIGYPVALKVVCRDLIHKSEAGAVRLDLSGPNQLASAWIEATAQVARLLPEAVIDGCLVQAMARGELELLVGARVDVQFGPVVTVGFGGLYAEVVDQVELAAAPLSIEAARRLLESLRLWPLLQGTRKRSPLDVESIASALSALGWLITDLQEELLDIEINPLMVGPRGVGVVAVDARGNCQPPRPQIQKAPAPETAGRQEPQREEGEVHVQG